MLPGLDPVDYSSVREVFQQLVHSEWFERDDDNIAECAKLVISEYSVGLDAQELRAACERLARVRFSKSRRDPRMLE